MAAKPLKKSVIKIARISFLLFTKEAYLLVKNLLGLVYHPFLTLRTIKKERDLSQTFLIGAFLVSPATAAIFVGIFALLLTKFFHLPAVPFKNLIFFANFSAVLFFAAAFSYLLYWVCQVIKKNHLDLN